MEEYKQKTYYIKTLGCQANEADSGTMSGILDALGFIPYKTEKEYKNENEELLDILPNIDVFIVNTCSVRQKSEDKVYGLGKVYKDLKKKPLSIVSGCMVGSATGDRPRIKFEELQKKTPWADYYINPSQIQDLPKILKEKDIDISTIIPIQKESKRAIVNISYGCDNFCTFCVVPYARGKEISRSKEQIISEITNLIKRGYKEFLLCGQNVNSWGLDYDTKFNIRAGSDQKLPFADLLRRLCEIQDIEKIEFISSNPFDFTEDLIGAIKHPKISNYMHIAVQSGSNEILKKMNRRHTIEEFKYLIKRLKEEKENVEIGTDIIVGFPGETKEQFFETAKLFEDIFFNVAFISMYSQRKGTPAYRTMKDDVTLAEKKWRHAYLNELWKKQK